MSFLAVSAFYFSYAAKKHFRRLAVLSLLMALCLLGHTFAHARLSFYLPQTFSSIPAFLKANHIETLDEYILWLKNNVNYSADGTQDKWADPLSTLNKRTGDCEDIAFLNAEVLKYFGYESRVLAYGHDKQAHVICLFIIKGKYYILDNTKYYQDITSPSLKEIFQFLAKKHQAQFLLELSREPRNLNVLYTASSDKTI